MAGLLPARAELLVAAAADLQPLSEALGKAYAASGGEPVKFVTGASGILARQIEQGAPFDVFLSANEMFVRDLGRSGKVLPGVVVYASGRLGLWSKEGGIRTLQDLARPEVKHIALPNPVHAPYGAAGKAALERLGLWAALQPKMVYGENVRQAFQFAQTGNADAVITSWSLLFDRDGILLPSDLHPPIRQAGAVVASSPHKESATRFLQFLAGPGGRKVLESYGLFTP